MKRRDFIKNCGIGIGAAMASGYLPKAAFSQHSIGNQSFAGEQFGLGSEQIRKILGLALSKGGDFSELYFEHTISSSLTMEEDIIKSSSEGITLGVGIRVIKGEQIGYGYTNDLTTEKLSQAALAAAAIASGSSKVSVAALDAAKPSIQCYDMTNPMFSLTITKKIDLVRQAYEAAKARDHRITKIQAMLGDEIQYVTIANSEGLLISDTRPQVRLYVSATAEEKGKKNTGRANAGGRIGLDFYHSVKTPEYIGTKAAEEAIILLSAKDAPAGEMPVVLGKEESGVMIHEAVGHPLEGDSNWKKQSIMWDKVGTMVANPIVTIYDDATIPHYRGSMNIDDEGTRTESVMLIEKGKLVGFLNDRLAAKMLKEKANGHGRRQSYRFPPIPRMNNTVLAKGTHDPDEIIASVKKGFYAVTYQGGEVSNTGKFTFSVNTGYVIEDGKLAYPVKNATLIGTNVQILKEVEMIGTDMGFFLGTCGKDGQSAAVTAGTPTLKIRKMTVGGIA